MSKKKVTKSEPISEEHKNFTEEIGTETDESVQTELDELESKIAEAKPAPVKPEKVVTEPEPITEKVVEPIEEVVEEEIPEVADEGEVVPETG